MHPNVELGDEICPKCESHTYERGCDSCGGDGTGSHDCGDDTCCCLAPMDNVRCDECEGHGYLEWCPTCGWDLLCNRYINGADERERATTAA
jgi:hypothetical protein